MSGSITQPDRRFGYSVFIMPLIYALAGILPQLVMYSRHELSIKEVLLRKFIQLLLIELVVNGIILGENALRPEYTYFIKTISICIVVVFVLANVISWIMDCASAFKKGDYGISDNKRFDCKHCSYYNPFLLLQLNCTESSNVC